MKPFKSRNGRKIQLPLSYLEKNFEHSQTQKITCQIIPHMLNYVQFYSKHNTPTSSVMLTDGQNNSVLISRSTYFRINNA